jgi:hypothetical protein
MKNVIPMANQNDPMAKAVGKADFPVVAAAARRRPGFVGKADGGVGKLKVRNIHQSPLPLLGVGFAFGGSVYPPADDLMFKLQQVASNALQFKSATETTCQIRAHH